MLLYVSETVAFQELVVGKNSASINNLHFGLVQVSMEEAETIVA